MGSRGRANVPRKANDLRKWRKGHSSRRTGKPSTRWGRGVKEDPNGEGPWPSGRPEQRYSTNAQAVHRKEASVDVEEMGRNALRRERDGHSDGYSETDRRC